jgi:hypothetical protein
VSNSRDCEACSQPTIQYSKKQWWRCCIVFIWPLIYWWNACSFCCV